MIDLHHVDILCLLWILTPGSWVDSLAALSDSEVPDASCGAMDSLNMLSSVFIMEWLLSNMYIQHTRHKASIMFHETEKYNLH